MERDDWQKTVEFLGLAFKDKNELDILKLLLTSDERSSLITRVKIIQSLLEGSINQRQLKDQLGIGIATITRGSNSLKEASPELKQWIMETLKKLNTSDRILVDKN